MKRYTYEILSGVTGATFQLPVFLEAQVDEMGIMVGFDGEFEQVEQFANFTYTSIGGVYGYYDYKFGDSPTACSNSADSNGTLYIKEQYSLPTIGQYVYSNQELTAPFSGDWGFWHMQREDSQWFSVHIADAGLIIGVVQCTAITPTPTPTPTNSLCPVPSMSPSVTPSFTPGISPTPSVTPTVTLSPTPTPSVTASLCP